MPTEKPRYTITLDEEMLKAIDDFRFEHRYPNRTQATLELIRLGMEALKKEQQETESTGKDEKEKTELETNDYMTIAAYDGGGIKHIKLTKEQLEKAKEIYKKLP